MLFCYDCMRNINRPSWETRQGTPRKHSLSCQASKAKGPTVTHKVWEGKDKTPLLKNFLGKGGYSPRRGWRRTWCKYTFSGDEGLRQESCNYRSSSVNVFSCSSKDRRISKCSGKLNGPESSDWPQVLEMKWEPWSQDFLHTASKLSW